MQLWLEEANGLRALLPRGAQARLLAHEAASTTATAEYQAAVEMFYDFHLCRAPLSPELIR